MIKHISLLRFKFTIYLKSGNKKINKNLLPLLSILKNSQMPKKLFTIILICIIFSGCKKENQNQQPSDHIKITLLSGNNQFAAIGNPLRDSVVVKVTNNGNLLANCSVQFTGSGCNSDLTMELKTKSDGTVKYSWKLAADLGKETLNIVAINKGVKVDSVIAYANAVSTQQKAERISACTPYYGGGGGAEDICQLTTGRLIACFQGENSLRYSDDNGISWNPILGFGKTHSVTAIITTPQNEIFATTEGEGIFYSKDAGNTWIDITPATFNKTSRATDLAYSNTGTLMITGPSNQFYSTNDKGKTWVTSVGGLPANFGFLFPCRLNNGEMYVVSMGFVLFKSVDGGLNWVAQNQPASEEVWAIYVDKNGLFYKAVFAVPYSNYTIVYVSKDNGQTFTQLYKTTNLIWTMSIQPDGYFYYSNFFTLSLFNQYGVDSNVGDIAGTFSNRCYIFTKNLAIYVKGNINY